MACQLSRSRIDKVCFLTKDPANQDQTFTERTSMSKHSSETEGRNQVTITYCPGCGWLLRSAWMAQEILTTFREEVDGLTLRPSKDESGVFRVEANGELVWCRNRDGGFPEIKALKQAIRDCLAPHRNLGHFDL